MSTDLLEKAKPQPAPLPSSAAVPAPGLSGQGGAAHPVKTPLPPHRVDDDDDDEEPGFLRRFRVVLGLGAAVAALAIYAFSGPESPSRPSVPRKAAVPINVSLPPPPLPPPPPPKVEPPKVEQPREEMEEETAPVDQPPDPAPDDSPPPIGTNNVGNGPADGFGLGKATSGSGTGGARRVGGGGSKYGFYAGQVQNTIASAIKRHSRTKSATMSVTARIWADDTGRVTRATLSGSSGDPAVDAALKNEVLTGLQLQSPPPAGMKMPINLRLTARAAR
jgi:protein TonB